MKSNRILAAMFALAAVACNEYEPYEVPGGVDSSKACVTSLTYNASTSAAAKVGLDIDAEAAINAGAVALTVELTTDETAANVENDTFCAVVYLDKASYTYDAMENIKSATFTANAGVGTVKATADYTVNEYVVNVVLSDKNFNGSKTLAAGATYYARARATYDGLKFSEWTYLTVDGEVMALTVGQGPVSPAFEAPSGLTVTATDEMMSASWNSVPFVSGYVFEYKASDASEWTSTRLVAPSVEIEGLTELTTYDVRVKAVKGDKETDYATSSVTTKEKSKFNPAISTADQLVQFFTTEASNASSSAMFTLEADIDVNGLTLPTVASFKGTLDGKGHAIKNWKSTGDPLFGTLTGTISNVVLDSSCSLVATYSADTAEDGVIVANFVRICDGGTITGCVNKCPVTLTVGGIAYAPIVAGIAGYVHGGTFSNNTNVAKISMTHAGTKNVAIAGLPRSSFSIVAGLVGLAHSVTVADCVNEGEVVVSCTAPSLVEARHYIGGVVGTPYDATISKCENKGNLTGNFGEGGAATTDKGKQVWIAGIVGGRNGDAKDFDGASIDNCKNYGNITLDIDYAANHYISGIGGQPHCEAASGLTGTETYGSRKITNCVNYGTLTKKGAAQSRIGGISAGAATIDNCENAGEIVIENIASAGAVGGLVGYPTQPNHPVTNSKFTGKMTAKCDVAFAFGGLFGQCGNTNQSYEGNAFAGVIEAPASVLAGALIGTAKTLGSGKTVSLGSAEKPTKVKGSVKGNTIDSSNLSSWISGDNLANAGGVIDIANVVCGD